MTTTDRPRWRRRGSREQRAPRAEQPGRTTTLGWHGESSDTEPPRRTMPVAYVWIVGAIALITGSLLTAPGIKKTALGQDVGWQRDVATFFADPLYDVSHTLYLDRPRAGLQAVIGRSGDDDIDLSLPSPTAPIGPGETPAPPPPRRAFSPADQAALYVVGDSLAQTPGESIINQALATQSIGILGVTDTHVGTGLSRPEVFNWPAYLADEVARDHPDAVVLTLGSNDDQSLTGDGGGESFAGPDWLAEYHRRVGGLMDTITASDETTLFWVGIPPMRNTERYDNRYSIINDIIKAEAALRPGKVVFVDTSTVLSPPGGGYSDYLSNPDGSVVQVRAGDGIHFTREGGDRIAGAVLQAIRQTFDLDSWMHATTTTAAPATSRTTTPKKSPKATTTSKG
jgi:uncharacterized protein